MMQHSLEMQRPIEAHAEVAARLAEWQAAQAAWDWADAAHVDLAAYRLKAAEEALRVALAAVRG